MFTVTFEKKTGESIDNTYWTAEKGWGFCKLREPFNIYVLQPFHPSILEFMGGTQGNHM